MSQLYCILLQFYVIGNFSPVYFRVFESYFSCNEKLNTCLKLELDLNTGMLMADDSWTLDDVQMAHRGELVQADSSGGVFWMERCVSPEHAQLSPTGRSV